MDKENFWEAQRHEITHDWDQITGQQETSLGT